MFFTERKEKKHVTFITNLWWSWISFTWFISLIYIIFSYSLATSSCQGNMTDNYSNLSVSSSSSLNSSFQDTEDDHTIARILAEEENLKFDNKLGKRLSHLDSIPVLTSFHFVSCCINWSCYLCCEWKVLLNLKSPLNSLW